MAWLYELVLRGRTGWGKCTTESECSCYGNLACLEFSMFRVEHKAGLICLWYDQKSLIGLKIDIAWLHESVFVRTYWIRKIYNLLFSMSFSILFRAKNRTGYISYVQLKGMD